MVHRTLLQHKYLFVYRAKTSAFPNDSCKTKKYGLWAASLSPLKKFESHIDLKTNSCGNGGTQIIFYVWLIEIVNGEWLLYCINFRVCWLLSGVNSNVKYVYMCVKYDVLNLNLFWCCKQIFYACKYLSCEYLFS